MGKPVVGEVSFSPFLRLTLKPENGAQPRSAFGKPLLSYDL